MLIVACETENNPEPQNPTPQPEINEPVLTLTSADVVEFGVEGGEGDILYTLENGVEGISITATCSDEWVQTKVFAEECRVSYTVAKNSSDARETSIVVAYGEVSFEVAIKQEAAPFEGYELSYMTGTYYAPGSEYNRSANHNFYVALSSVDDFTTYAASAVYVELDFYAAEGDAENPVIPAGEYTLDVEDSGAPGTIGCSYSRLLEMDADWMPIVWILPTDGKVVVSENKIEGYLVDEYGIVASFRYTGSLAVEPEEVVEQ